MGFNTYPYSPFPASTEQLHKGDNEDLQAQINAIKDGATLDSFADVESALALKQNITDNNLTTTNKTTTGAINELMSGLTNVADDVKLNTQDLTTPSRTKNLLPITLETLKSINTSGTWTNNVYNYRSVDITVYTDGGGNVTRINANGTATGGNLYFRLVPNTYDIVADTILNGCASGGSSTTFSIVAFESDDTTVFARDIGNGVSISAAHPDVNMYIHVAQGTNINKDFYPMLRPASITDSTFAPYVPSVESRIEAVESGLTGLIKATVVEDKVNVDSNGYINLSTLGFDSTYKFVSVIVKGLSSSVDYYAQVWRSYSYGWVVTIYQNGTFTKLTDPSIDLNISVIGFK